MGEPREGKNDFTQKVSLPGFHENSAKLKWFREPVRRVWIRTKAAFYCGFLFYS